MTKGEGFVGLLYAIRDIIEAGVIWVLTGIAVLAFFYIIIGFIGSKMNLQIPFIKKVEPRGILWAIIILTIIFSLYSLIALLGAIFGVNSSPAGGIYSS